jgi:hypothetical protein
MSITRLQQARQMYAMGQRVGRIAFGDGSNMRKIRGQDHMLAYITPSEKDILVELGGRETMTPEGILAYPPEGNYGSEAKGPGSGPTGGITGMGVGGGNHVAGDGTGNVTGPDNSHVSDTQQYNHNEVIEQNTGKKNPLRPEGVDPGFIKPKDAVDLGLGLRPYEQKRVDFLNQPYEKFKVPFLFPGSNILNTVGNVLGGKLSSVNKNFFVNNVLGKHGYNTVEDYQRYMKDRMSGEVSAYGNPALGQNAINQLTGNSSGGEGGGIMDVVVDDTTDDEEDTTNDLILRFLHDKPEEVINLEAMGVTNTDEMLQAMLDRAKNIYTTEDA